MKVASSKANSKDKVVVYLLRALSLDRMKKKTFFY